MNPTCGRRIVSSEATEEEIRHIRTGTLDQVEAIAMLRAFDPGAWIRIAFDATAVASKLRLRGEPFVRSVLDSGQTSQLMFARTYGAPERFPSRQVSYWCVSWLLVCCPASWNPPSWALYTLGDLFARVRLQFLFTSRALIYMVRIYWERQPMLLFSDPHRVDPVSFRSFHDDRSLGKHNVQMGLPEGVLLHFFHNGSTYQAVLVSMSSAPSKSKKGEHAMWKHVLPISTDFAWLPHDVADAFCSLDNMVPSMRCSWASMSTTRQHYTSKDFTI